MLLCSEQITGLSKNFWRTEFEDAKSSTAGPEMQASTVRDARVERVTEGVTLHRRFSGVDEGLLPSFSSTGRRRGQTHYPDYIFPRTTTRAPASTVGK